MALFVGASKSNYRCQILPGQLVFLNGKKGRIFGVRSSDRVGFLIGKSRCGAAKVLLKVLRRLTDLIVRRILSTNAGRAGLMINRSLTKENRYG